MFLVVRSGWVVADVCVGSGDGLAMGLGRILPLFSLIRDRNCLKLAVWSLLQLKQVGV